MATYSLALTGRPAGQTFAVSSLAVSDAALADGNHNLPMRLGSQILCKNPDGSQTWHTIDNERSTPSNLVMKAVGP
jgi:hypothetical protein